ncbi:MAG: rhodanese-like domain-containing protein [Spirosomaceae bacterium]|jgi:rhodanese-related sulfurtransferase|nr:rhodanese-like domain-containing protein [Spirosomataceae bacterium]
MGINEDISVEQLKELIDSGAAINLIDVREDYEYEDDNLGGKLIPLGTLLDNLEELEPLKDQEIIIHCRSGARSGRAKEYLNAQGFTNVRNVLGGIMAYRNL